jgi:cyclin-dependent kinase 12/13
MKRNEKIVELVEIVTCGARRGVNSSPGEDDEHTGGNSSIYMVFEYMEFDLQGLLNASKVDPNVKITSFHVRSWTKQLLEGVAFIHQNNMLHRDLKGGNILISADNRLKIADFGLARPEFQNVQKYTGNLLTLGFRPPEVMMGMPKYTNSVDMWSVGCILAELLLRKPLFPVYQGQSEIDHLASIFKICGTPKISEESPQLAPNSQYRYDLWPSVATDCLNWKCYESNQPLPRLLQNEFEGNAHEILRHKPLRVGKPGISIHAVDLLEKMLHLDPHKRITAQNALDHDYFFKEGPVKTHTQLPKFKITSAHEMEIRNQHLERRDKLNAQREKASQANAAQAYP